MKSAEASISKTAAHIRSYGAVVILGAGASFHVGLPMFSQLPDLLWDALQADPDLMTSLQREHGWSGSSGKSVIGEDKARIRIVFRAIAGSDRARQAFQREFAKVNSRHLDRRSTTHEVLAELVHRGLIDLVISLNWDTLLEGAYADKYGRQIHAGESFLYKPHGDAADPNGRWILPFADDENMEVIEGITTHLNSLAGENPRVLLVIGYSESDEIILDRIIRPFTERWRVVRIGPSNQPSKELRIALRAEEVLPQLLAHMDLPEEVPGWEYIKFDNQHDLAFVFSRQALGASEVEACPELPEVNEVIKELSNSHLALISGLSGSGKTITTLQAAYRSSQEGFEILRLTEDEQARARKFRRTDIDAHVKELTGLHFPTLVILDDAQNIDRQFLRRIREIVSPNLKAILTYNDDEYVPGNTTYIDNRGAVTIIADALRARRDEATQALRTVDENIGDGRLDVPIERRIEEALEACRHSENTGPWQFIAVLTGIESKAKNQITYLHNKDRADLLLAAIAAGQIVTRDGGVTRDWLDGITSSLDRNSNWVDSSLNELRKMRLTVGTKRLRSPHLRFAAVALTTICKESLGADKEIMVKMLRAAVLDPESSLQGITWLLNEIKYAGGTGAEGYGLIVDDETWDALTDRCWSALGEETRREAALLLSALLDWRPQGHLRAIAAHVELLGRWVSEAGTSALGGISVLIHDLLQNAHHLPDALEVAEHIWSYVDPDLLAHKFAEITWAEASVWGHALSNVMSAAGDNWKGRFAASINRGKLQQLVESATPSKLYPLNSLTQAMWSVDEWLGVDVMYWATPKVAQALNDNPLDAFHQIQHELEHKYWAISIAAKTRTSGKHVDALRAFGRALDVDAIAGAISETTTRRAWDTCYGLLFFLKIAFPRRAKAVVRKLNIEKLEQATKQHWTEMPEELTSFLWAISQAGGQSIVESWITEHAHEISHVNVRLLETAPSFVARRVRSGATFAPSANPWVPVSVIIPQLAKVDEEAARQVAERHGRAIAYTLANSPAKGSKEQAALLDALDRLFPALTATALSMIPDAEAAGHHWTKVLQEGDALARKVVLRILEVAAATEHPVAQVAKRLLEKPPKRKRKK